MSKNKSRRRIHKNPCPPGQADKIYTNPRPGARRQGKGPGIARGLAVGALVLLTIAQPEIIPLSAPAVLVLLGSKKKK